MHFLERDSSLEWDRRARTTAPGIRIERRGLLRLSAAGAAALLASGIDRICAEAQAEGSTGWENFIEEGSRIGKELLGGPGGEDGYVLGLAAIAVRLRLGPQDLPDAPTRPFGGLEPKVFFGPVHRGTPFVVIQWRMDPGATLPPHCHPNYSVCTLGLEGSARLRNYEVASGAPAPDSGSREPFDVVQTHDEIMSRGRVNTLTPSRDNVHSFDAGPEGARGIDITSLHGDERQFSFLRIDPLPKDGSKGLYQGIWIGPRPGM